MEHRLSALLQLHLHSRLNIWLQGIQQRQPQESARIFWVLGFGASYIRDLTVIKNLKSGSAAGWDEISTKIVKSSCFHIRVMLTHIFNLSLLSGIFPNELKIARVVPLFKSGDPQHFSNHRPASILPIFSKILERFVYNRILSHINSHNLLHCNQFGFKNEHIPNLAMICLVDKISNKMEYFGVRGIAHAWIKCYLSNRKQYVEYNSCKSSCKGLSCGVPQGSILGPLLFLIYIYWSRKYISEIVFLVFCRWFEYLLIR